MYQPKFMPYNQMNDVYQEDQFEQQDSQPLIQEVDPNYQPNDRQIRQYAIDVLGMNLPEDQRLLYLAKQGLKAPLPTNWQPYQGRDGEVYYKHKITQQKTYQHPTDVQYRKKYVQQKQRMARKNLKSMNLKSNPLSGLGQPFGSGALSLGPKSGINPLGLSNLSSQSHQTISKQISKLDPKIQQQLQKQVEQLQSKLKKQFRQFQAQRQLQHDRNMKKYKSDFQNNLKQLKTQKSSLSLIQSSIKQQKQRLKQRLKQAYQDRFKEEFVQVERQEQKKYNQFVQLYEEDNKIKIKKYEAQKQAEFVEKVKKVENQQKKHKQTIQSKIKQRQKTLSQIKSSFEEEGNRQIQQATKDTFQKQLKIIKDKNAQKISEFQLKLQNQYLEMKKLLGHDPNQLLQQMAQKKTRLKKMAQQKLQSLKKKQYQKVASQYQQQLSRAIRQAESNLQTHHVKQLQSHRQLCTKKLQSMKNQLQGQQRSNIDRKIQQTYSQIKKSTTQYQKQKNKKILELRQLHISQVLQKTTQKNDEINIKINIKDKEDMIQNKEQLIQSLRKQLELEKLVLKDLLMSKNIVSSKNIDEQLKKIMLQYGIKYKPQIFLKHQKRFNQLKIKFKTDKKLLASMMSQLQGSSFLSFYNRNHHSDQGNGTSSTSLLIKQYNKDVRIMRNNQQMLSKYQLVLKKAQVDDQQALKQLQGDSFDYQQISLRSNIRGDFNDGDPRLNEIQNVQQMEGQKNHLYGNITTNSYKSVQDSLKQHSKFLSNVRAQLNRKLYKVRSNNFYRI